MSAVHKLASYITYICIWGVYVTERGASLCARAVIHPLRLH